MKIVMSFLRRSARMSVLALPVFLAVTSANAQVLEEIIVTAQKREETLLEIPVSIVAQTGERLQELNLLNPVDMSTFIPSLNMRDTVTGINTSIRGVGTAGGNPAFEPSVASFIDGAYLGRDRTTTTAFLDMERVEIVRGPQPLFAGQNAVAGAINLISRRPGDEFDGYVRLQAGSNEENRVEFAVGGPITETFGARIAGIRDERGGWVTNGPRDARASEDNSVRATLVWEPTDRLSATFILTDYESWGEGSTEEYAYCEAQNDPMRGYNTCLADPEATINDVTYDGVRGISSAVGALPPGPPLITFAGMGFPAGAFDANAEFLGNATERREQEGNRYNLIFEYAAENYTFTSQTNQIEFDFFQLTDVDTTQVDFFHVPIFNDYEVTQQEFRIQSNDEGDSRISWMGGLYWQESEFNNDNVGALLAASSMAPLLGTAPVADYRAAPPFPNDLYFSEEAEWLSAYFNLGISLGDRVTLDIGARYTDVEKTGQAQNGTGYYDLDGTGTVINLVDSNLGPGCAFGTEVNAFAMGGGFNPDAEVCVAGRVDNDSTDPQIQLSGYVTDDTMLFARYAEGFKSGGFSVGMSPADVDAFVYDPEEAETFEVGVKTGFADGRGELSVVMFTTEFKNRQVSALALGFSAAPEFIIQNAAASTSEGIEFDGRFAATDNLTFTFAGSILDSVYDSYPGASCDGYKHARNQNGCVNPALAPPGQGQSFFDAAGLDTDGSQPWELMLGARWETTLGNGFRLTYSADLALIDYHNVWGLRRIEESQYQNGTEEQLNMRLALSPPSGNYEIALYADNVTDNRRFFDVGSDAIGYDENVTLNRVQGSTYGLQARFNFGN